jgi:hypothetical protein
MSRASKPPQRWMSRSASVDLPWSMCAMMEKFLMCCIKQTFQGVELKKDQPEKRARI